MSEQEFNSYLATVDISCNGHEIKSRWFFSVDEGWLQLIHDLIVDLFRLGWDGDLEQCKEKFGGLRFYIGGASSEIYDAISRYENQSFKVCEKCGQTGSNRLKGNWMKTLCENHAKELGYE